MFDGNGWVMICCKVETPTVSRDVSITSKPAAVSSVSVTPSASESVSTSAAVNAVSTIAQCHLTSASGSNTAVAMDLFSPARDCKCIMYF